MKEDGSFDVKKKKQEKAKKEEKKVEKKVEKKSTFAQQPERNPIGDKLLQGWCMLGEHCPVCFNPILKDPSDNKMWCVVCEAQAVRPEDVPQQKTPIVEAEVKTPQQAVRQEEKERKKGAEIEIESDLKQTLTSRLEEANRRLAGLEWHEMDRANQLLDHIAKMLSLLKTL
jgi:uncharacterized Zn finger protein (UPF0148 family)